MVVLATFPAPSLWPFLPVAVSSGLLAVGRWRNLPVTAEGLASGHHPPLEVLACNTNICWEQLIVGVLRVQYFVDTVHTNIEGHQKYIHKSYKKKFGAGRQSSEANQSSHKLWECLAKGWQMTADSWQRRLCFLLLISLWPASRFQIYSISPVPSFLLFMAATCVLQRFVADSWQLTAECICRDTGFTAPAVSNLPQLQPHIEFLTGRRRRPKNPIIWGSTPKIRLFKTFLITLA